MMNVTSATIRVDPGALRHAVLVALPTIGLAAALDALRWIDETIDERGSQGSAQE